MGPEFKALGICPTDRGIVIVMQNERVAREAYQFAIEHGHNVELAEDRIIWLGAGSEPSAPEH